MKVVIETADMDTVLAGLLLGVSAADEIAVVREQASMADLADPAVLCIEAGGSGLTTLGNFDHHDTSFPLPTACQQAAEVRGVRDERVRRLVAYVSEVDTGTGAFFQVPRAVGPSLSTVFSGMRLTEAAPRSQFLLGLDLFRTALALGLDPYAAMPALSDWLSYIAAARLEGERLAGAMRSAARGTSASGLEVGWVTTEAVGALGGLYRLGCEVAIALHPRFGDPAIRKFTVAARTNRVDHLLPTLRTLEPGWGGPSHGTIIASPRTGTVLETAVVVQVVLEGT